MACAATLGAQPSSAMAWFTRSRAAGLTVAAPLTTRETVPIDTPATRATSCTVMR